RGRGNRPDRARLLHPAAGHSWCVGTHPRALDPRAIPRTQPRALVRQRRRSGDLLLLGGLDGTQPDAARGNLLPDPRQATRRARVRRGVAELPRRQRAGVVAGFGRAILPRHAGRRAAAFRANGFAGALRRLTAASGAGCAAAPRVPSSVRRAQGDAHKENSVPACTTSLRDGDLLAAVDLGSNSFHMVVARYEQGAPRLIDRLRESVRLAAGLRADGTLDPAHRALALNCLARFGQRLAGLPPERVRAVATNTVRRLRAPQAFLRLAERALGHTIEVVSGREEARLIWQGVSHALPSSRSNRLVIDVGGGSTEFIIGRGLEPRLTESVQIGCVASTLRFFPNGRITRRRWQHAIDEIGVQLQQFAA